MPTGAQTEGDISAAKAPPSEAVLGLTKKELPSPQIPPANRLPEIKSIENAATTDFIRIKYKYNPS